KRVPESMGDYDFPDSREADGDSRYVVYAKNNDSLPLAARDREDGTPLNPRTEWPQPPSPDLLFVQHTKWSTFLERYYHPVADNRILYAITPDGAAVLPTEVGGGACLNPTDTITVPVGSTIFFSGAGSSDADQPAGILPSYYFWDRDDRVA